MSSIISLQSLDMYIPRLYPLKRSCAYMVSNYYTKWVQLSPLSSNRHYLPSCTSSGCILQLCKMSSVLVNLFICFANKTDRRTHRLIPFYLPKNFVCGGIYIWRHLSQSFIRPSIYFSLIMKSHLKPLLEPTSTKQSIRMNVVSKNSSPF